MALETWYTVTPVIFAVTLQVRDLIHLLFIVLVLASSQSCGDCEPASSAITAD